MGAGAGVSFGGAACCADAETHAVKKSTARQAKRENRVSAWLFLEYVGWKCAGSVRLGARKVSGTLRVSCTLLRIRSKMEI